MTVSFYANTETRPAPSPQLMSRFEPTIRLETGKTSFAITRLDPLFEDQSVSFGRVQNTLIASHPTEWLLRAIIRIADAVDEDMHTERPIHLPLPLAVFSDADVAQKVANLVGKYGLCTQEIMLEVQDASLASGEEKNLDVLDSFRAKGFRIALDARKSSETPFSGRIRGAIERLRVNAEDLLFDETLQMRAEIVSSLGGQIILDRAQWRHVDQLRALGATHALKLIADA